MGPSPVQSQQLDPITFEILRHQLDEVIAEAYHTIGRVTGSPTVYEAGDHQEAILTADGQLVVFAAGVLHWVRSLAAGVQHVLKTYCDNPGLREGDQFILNDPYIATVHANDVQLLAPIFHQGKLIAWAATASHQSDVGGIDPGSVSPRAEEFFQEGFATPGMKLVEQGVIRKDIEDTFKNMIRTPELGLLDVRAKIAANNVIKSRISQMLGRYGEETILTLFQQLIRYSEAMVRSKLRGIPDGTWTAMNFLEGLREPYLKVQITVTKSDDHIVFDFTGSSPQSDGSQNIGRIGTISSAMNPFILMLCHDVPWSEGLFKVVDFVIPEGTIVNPRKPAALSYNIGTGGCMLTMTTAHNVLSKMLLTSEAFRTESCGNIGASFNYFIFAGSNRDGSYFVLQVLDAGAGGIGGFADQDGASTAQNHWGVKTMISNVETNEMMYPVMYLWRKEVMDSGGAGKFRGGVGMMGAMMPWEVDQLLDINVGCGLEPRDCLGVSGGYPAPNVRLGLLRDARVRERHFSQGRVPRSLEEIDAPNEAINPTGFSIVRRDDVIWGNFVTGGGGFGDPLERSPEMVLADVREGDVSAAMAEKLYGVIVDVGHGVVDTSATVDLRQRRREERFEKGRRHGQGA